MGIGRVDGPAAEQAAAQRVLEDLVGGTIIDDPERGAVGDEALGIGVTAIQTKAAGGGLAAGEAAGGTGVLEDLVLFGVHDPDVGAVGGNPFELGARIQAAGGPGPQQAAAG